MVDISRFHVWGLIQLLFSIIFCIFGKKSDNIHINVGIAVIYIIPEPLSNQNAMKIHSHIYSIFSSFSYNHEQGW